MPGGPFGQNRGPTHQGSGPWVDAGESYRGAGGVGPGPIPSTQQPTIPGGVPVFPPPTPIEPRTPQLPAEDPMAKLQQLIQEQWERSDANRREALNQKMPKRPSGNLGWKEALIAGGLAMGLNMIDPKKQAGASFGEGYLGAHGKKVDSDYQNAFEEAMQMREKMLGEAGIDADQAIRLEGQKGDLRAKLDEEGRKVPKEVRASIRALQDPFNTLTEPQVKEHYQTVQDFYDKRDELSPISRADIEGLLRDIREKNRPESLDDWMHPDVPAAIAKIATAVNRIAPVAGKGKAAFDFNNLGDLHEANQQAKDGLAAISEVARAYEMQIGIFEVKEKMAETEQERADFARKAEAFRKRLARLRETRAGYADQIAALSDQMQLWGTSAQNDGFGVWMPPNIEAMLEALVGFKRQPRRRPKQPVPKNPNPQPDEKFRKPLPSSFAI